MQRHDRRRVEVRQGPAQPRAAVAHLGGGPVGKQRVDLVAFGGAALAQQPLGAGQPLADALAQLARSPPW